jgi:hypothetical protein
MSQHHEDGGTIVDVYLGISVVYCPLHVQTLQWASPYFKEF